MPIWHSTKFEASTETLIVMDMDEIPHDAIEELRSRIRNREEYGMEGMGGIILLLDRDPLWWEDIHPLLAEMATQAKRNLRDAGRNEIGYLYLDPD